MNRRLPPQHTPRAAASHPLQNPYEGGGNHIFGGCFAATTVADKISNIEGIVERILIYYSPLPKPTSRCRRSLASARGTTLSRRRRRQRSQPPRARRRRSRRRSRSPRLTVRPSPLPVTLDPLKKLSDSAWLGDTGLRTRRAQLHRHPTYDHTWSHYASVRVHTRIRKDDSRLMIGKPTRAARARGPFYKKPPNTASRSLTPFTSWGWIASAGWVVLTKWTSSDHPEEGDMYKARANCSVDPAWVTEESSTAGLQMLACERARARERDGQGCCCHHPSAMPPVHCPIAVIPACYGVLVATSTSRQRDSPFTSFLLSPSSS